MNPDYIIKDDKKRFVLYSKRIISNRSSKNWISFIHPMQAKILSFFCSNNTFENTIQLLANYLNISGDRIETMISKFVNNEKPFYTIFNGEKILFPKNVLVNRPDDINFKSDEFIVDLAKYKNVEIDIKDRRVQSMPISLTIMLTNRCLTKCIYCYADTKTVVENPLSTERIIEIIKESKSIGIQNINLLGGEIFLHKNWKKILNELILNNYCPDFISTKIPLTKNIIDGLLDIGYSGTIQISLDSLESDILVKTLCVNSNYIDLVVKGIMLIDESPLKYRIVSVLTSFIDAKGLFDMFQLMQTLKHISIWRISPVVNSLYINNTQIEELKPHKEKLLSLMKYVADELKPISNFNIDFVDTYVNRKYFSSEGGTYFEGAYCSALYNHMFVLPDGAVTICEQLYWNPNFVIGDLTTMSISDVWNSKKALELVYIKKDQLNKQSACSSCEIFDKCFNLQKRCWADVVKAYGWKNWDFPDPRCAKAPAMEMNLDYV